MLNLADLREVPAGVLCKDPCGQVCLDANLAETYAKCLPGLLNGGRR